MKPLFTTVLCCYLLFSCQEAAEKKTVQPAVDTITAVVDSTPTYSMRNPALMGGFSDLLNILRRMSISQNYQDMLRLTSRLSIEKYGERRIMEFYKRQGQDSLGLQMSLKSAKYNRDSTSCTLNYELLINLTKHYRLVECRIENDTARLYLENLKSLFVEQ